MDFSIVYIVFVDIDRNGSYMNHVNGFIEGILSQKIKMEVYAKGRSGINSKFLRFTGLLPKIIAYTILDLVSAFKIMISAKNCVFVLRPYRFTIFTYLAIRVRNAILIQENNGILHDELIRNGLKFQSFLYKYIEGLVKNIPVLHVCVSSGILKHYKKLNISGELYLSSNGISKKRFYERKSCLNFEKGLRLLFIGKLSPWQGLSQFLDYLVSNPNKSVISITVIGDGTEKSAVCDLLNKLKCETNYIGWSSWEEIQKHSENCNIGLIPRLDTSICGSPLKMFDYLALGLPIISTEIDGIIDVLNQSNLYFKFCDSEKSSMDAIWAVLKSQNENILHSEMKSILNKYEWGNISEKITIEIEKRINH